MCDGLCRISPAAIGAKAEGRDREERIFIYKMWEAYYRSCGLFDSVVSGAVGRGNDSRDSGVRGGFEGQLQLVRVANRAFPFVAGDVERVESEIEARIEGVRSELLCNDGGTVDGDGLSGAKDGASFVADSRTCCDVSEVHVNGRVGEGVDAAGDGKYVPPQRRGGGVPRFGPNGGKSIGRGPNYCKNQVARERRAAAKRVDKGSDSETSYVDKNKYNNKASFFDGMPKGQVDELQRTRTEAMLAKNRAEIVRQRTAEKRAVAEATLLDRELESGAFENRIRTRNEAMDRRSQDQSENIEFYRNARGWAETIKSGEPTPARGPSNVPSLSSGGSPRSESDWELEVKRRDEQNEVLRKELDQARKELETYEQSAYDPMKGVVSVYEPCEYVMDGASRFDQAGFMEEYRQKDRARDFSVPLGTHIRPKEEVKLVGM